jgi:PP-loop superfamily ATP-utilizing enzyme
MKGYEKFNLLRQILKGSNKIVVAYSDDFDGTFFENQGQF